MKKSILLVEDNEGHTKFLVQDIATLSDGVSVLPTLESFQEVNDEVVNSCKLPDCAIVDVQIFEHSSDSRLPGARPDTRWGIEALERLLAAKMPTSRILVLTAFLGTVETDINRLGLLDRALRKPIHPEKLKSEVIKMLTS